MQRGSPGLPRCPGSLGWYPGAPELLHQQSSFPASGSCVKGEATQGLKLQPQDEEELSSCLQGELRAPERPARGQQRDLLE